MPRQSELESFVFRKTGRVLVALLESERYEEAEPNRERKCGNTKMMADIIRSIS